MRPTNLISGKLCVETVTKHEVSSGSVLLVTRIGPIYFSWAVADPEGVQGVRANPPLRVPVFK